ncbi:MAG TPA: hypothetical protein VKE22_20735 [Haliangiales bacterium]|nr:hypothetical protein [Haliangiales bacterium]
MWQKLTQPAEKGRNPAAGGAARLVQLAGIMGTYVETWKGIAHSVSRSERWCRYMARRAADPLPVFKVGGIVRMNLIDLDAWLSRQRGAYLMAS